MSGESLIIGDLYLAGKTNKLLGYTLEDGLFTAKEMNFERNSVGTYMSGTGVLSSAAAGIARKQVSSLLMEKQRANLLPTYNTLRLITGLTVSGSTATETSGSSGRSLVVGNGNVTLTANTTYCFSIIVKKTSGSNRWVRLHVSDTIGNLIRSKYLDLQTGLLTGINEYANPWIPSSLSSGVINLNNGYYQLYVTGALPSNTTLPSTCYPWFFPSSGGSNVYSGDPSVSYNILGGQVEVGFSPTSLIQTSGVSATRSGDICYKNNFNLPIEHTINIEFLLNAGNLANDVSNYYLYAASDGSGKAYYIRRTNNTFYLDVDNTTYTGIPFYTINNPIIGSIFKIAISITANSINIFVNGQKETSTTLSTPNLNTSANTIVVGNGSTFNDSQEYNGVISKFAIFPTALSDSQCVTLTQKLSAETLAWKSRVESNGGALPLGVLDIFDTYFFRPALQHGNILNQLDRFNVYSGLVNYQIAARTNLINNTYYVTPVNNPIFDINGYKSNGVNSYLDLNLNGAGALGKFTDSDNIAGYVVKNPTYIDYSIGMGAAEAVNNFYIQSDGFNGNYLSSFNNSTTEVINTTSGVSDGFVFFATRRTSNTSSETLINQFSFSATNNSVPFPSLNQYELAGNFEGFPVGYDTQSHYCSFHGSSSLDYEAFRSIVTNLLDALPTSPYRP